jgi:hypothetical protein
MVRLKKTRKIAMLIVLENPLDTKKINAIDTIMVKIRNIISLAELLTNPLVFALYKKLSALPGSSVLFTLLVFWVKLNPLSANCRLYRIIVQSAKIDIVCLFLIIEIHSKSALGGFLHCLDLSLEIPRGNYL